jgi:ABC-type microcin C transport system duplicated ATPase subunit YejF
MKLLPYPSARHPSGSILFKGQDLMRLSERDIRRHRGCDITIVFQEPMTSLNPLHTIEKQLAEILQLHGGVTGKAARARIVELLSLCGIPDPESRLQSYPHQLSGGQRQRVMIAMALANEPDLLIADEPTTALDVTVQAQILQLLKDLQSRLGMAMLFITHDLGIVRRIAERVCVMKHGKIVEHGPVEQVFKRAAASLHLRSSRRRAQGPAGAAQSAGRRHHPHRRSQGLVPDQAWRDAQGCRPHQGGRRREHRGAARARRWASSANPAPARRRWGSRSCG